MSPIWGLKKDAFWHLEFSNLKIFFDIKVKDTGAEGALWKKIK